jgi:quercetin dioxygenase-like cupin family protein
MREYKDTNFTTSLFGILPNSSLSKLREGFTHFGIILKGEVRVTHDGRRRQLFAGDFFSVTGTAWVQSLDASCMVISAKNYLGLNVFGGPLEEKGRLRYIDGCTDTLLVPPVRKGDPCFNHLHFPANIVQTPHTHPSVRVGIVYRGRGECVVPHGPPIPLQAGYAFIVETNAEHSFNTLESTMDIVAFHPDSDAGMTDEDHPMLNRTIVDGESAKNIPNIQTKK